MHALRSLLVLLGLGSACLGSACRPEAERAQAPAESRDTKPGGTSRAPTSQPSAAAPPEGELPATTGASGASSEAAAELREIVFTATVVRAAEPARGRAAEEDAISVGADPRWSISLRIESIEQGSAPFVEKTERTFLIHSPTKTFRGDEPRMGARYRLRLTVAGDEETPRFVRLMAAP